MKELVGYKEILLKELNRDEEMSIFGVNVSTNASFTMINDFILHGRGPLYKINPEFLVRAKEDILFRDVLNRASIKAVDGIGVQWAAHFLTMSKSRIPLVRDLKYLMQWAYSLICILFYPKILDTPIRYRTPGLDLFLENLKVCQNNRVSVYFLGSTEQVLNGAIQKLKKEYPKLRLAGHSTGDNLSNDKIVNMINISGAEVLFVAFGCPKQEFWINDNFKKLKRVRVAIGEGGTFDFVSGSFLRAPFFLRRLGLEWIWRLFFNKSKTATGSRARRIFNAVPKFMILTYLNKLKNEKN